MEHHNTEDTDRSTEEPAPPDATLAVVRGGGSERIGPYRLLRQIGEGGFGVVYHAEQTKPVKRRVALKIIKPGMDSVAVIARFEAERQALALMNHPNVAKVFDAGTTSVAAGSRPYFVMEHIAGVRITEYCTRQKLSIERRLKLFMSVCNAVQHAHQKGIIHRDIKPSNILVTVMDGEPVPKVIDFGVAKAISQPLTEKTMFTEEGQLIGTPAYMSPEQAEMNSENIDTRSDIYSLGVLLYEMLTSALPFDPSSLRNVALDQICRTIREVDPPKPSTKGRVIARYLRGDLDWIIMKALEKDRSRRYASPSDFAADIKRHMNDEPVEACPPSSVYHVSKFVRRNRSHLVLAAAILAGVVLTASIYTFHLNTERNAKLAAQHKLLAEREQRDRRIGELLDNIAWALAAEEISLVSGESTVVHSSPADHVEIFDPDVARVQPLGSTQFRVTAADPGSTHMFTRAENGGIEWWSITVAAKTDP